jgi:hypothetical protein
MVFLPAASAKLRRAQSWDGAGPVARAHRPKAQEVVLIDQLLSAANLKLGAQSA